MNTFIENYKMTLSNSIKNFLLHCRYEKNLNFKTIKAYQIDLLQLYKTLGDKNSDVLNISKTELREFLISVSSLKPKSIKRKVASLKVFFNYLEFEDILLVNPLRKMRIKIKDAIRLPVVMDLKEVSAIFKVVYSFQKNFNVDTSAYSESLRNAVIIELLFSTGARVSEIANLKIDDINLESGCIKIKGKGNKERFIHLCNNETIIILKKYYKSYKDRIERSGGYLLINKLGKKLSEQSIRSLVKKLALKASIRKHITPHIFRHSFATLLLEEDVDIRYIQRLLGHSSIMTTQIYTHVNLEKQRQVLKSKHPRRELSFAF